MGFDLRIEGSYDSLSNLHPDGTACGGSAILSFLTGLQIYRDREEAASDKDPMSGTTIRDTIEWHLSVEQSVGMNFFPTCQPLLDCIWGDGGDPMECYGEEDYEFYVRRPAGITITKEQFLAGLRESRIRWQPVADVMSGVRLLLDVFHRLTGTSFEVYYQPEHTVPDFEALLANLELLAKRGNKLVRLNFS